MVHAVELAVADVRASVRFLPHNMHLTFLQRIDLKPYRPCLVRCVIWCAARIISYSSPQPVRLQSRLFPPPPSRRRASLVASDERDSLSQCPDSLRACVQAAAGPKL